MRVHVVSDVHGNADGVTRAADGAEALLVLGDLINLIDYRDHANGIRLGVRCARRAPAGGVA